MELPWWLIGKESTCNAEDTGLIPGSGRSPEKARVTHFSIFAWDIHWTEEPGRIQPIGSQRVRHYLATKQNKIESKQPIT